MAVRKSWETGNKTYSADSHINDIEHQIASILYISGLDGSNIDNYEIDDSINALRESFKVTKESILVGSPKSGMRPAYQFFMAKNSSRLSTVLRRNRRWLKIARHARGVSNG